MGNILVVNGNKYDAEKVRVEILEHLESITWEPYSDKSSMNEFGKILDLMDTIQSFIVDECGIEEWDMDKWIDTTGELKQVQEFIDSEKFDNLYREIHKKDRSFRDEFTKKFEGVVSLDSRV